MPSDDLVLNVRQIEGYPPATSVIASDAILLQRGGLGGPYLSIDAPTFVGTALAQGGDMAIAGGVSAWSFNGGSAQFSNASVGMFSAQNACIVNFSANWGSINGVPIATRKDLAAQYAASVQSFNGRVGNVRLWIDDIRCAGGAPIFSPRFEGSPRACTPPPTSNSTRLATTAFVQGMIAGLTLDFAPLDSPAFTGVPTAPTPAVGSSDGQLATTAFVANAVSESTTGVSSFNTRTGAVTLVANDISAASGALLASPAFTGTPSAPTPPPGDSSTRLATTAFVAAQTGFAPIASPAFTGVPTAPTAAVGTNSLQLATTAFVLSEVAASTAGVASFNGRTGAVTLLANDLTAAGGALLASPALTGTPSAPTAAPGTSTTQLATTAFVAAVVTGDIKSVHIQKFTGNGTYTPTAGMAFCLVEMVGGGGGGAGVPAATASGCCAGSGGGSGAYSRALLTAAQIGASKPVTRGVGGTAGLAGVNQGGAGGASSLGALVTAPGGTGGQSQGIPSNFLVVTGGGGGVAGTGDLALPGNDAPPAVSGVGTGGNTAAGGNGAASYFGGAPGGGNTNGFNAPANSGCGGSGGATVIAGNMGQGGAGGTGVVIITEFCTQ